MGLVNLSFLLYGIISGTVTSEVEAAATELHRWPGFEDIVQATVRIGAKAVGLPRLESLKEPFEPNSDRAAPRVGQEFIGHSLHS